MSSYRWLAQRIEPYLHNIRARLTFLEYIVSKTADALSQLDAATNDVAAKLDDLAAQLAAVDTDVANQVQAHADRLRSLAADPENPVPAEPSPEPPVSDGPVA